MMSVQVECQQLRLAFTKLDRPTYGPSAPGYARVDARTYTRIGTWVSGMAHGDVYTYECVSGVLPSY